MAPIVFNWSHLAVVDLDGTNFYKFYGRFKEIGLLEVEAVFHWLYEFGLDVLLRIDVKITEFIFISKLRFSFYSS